jgi:hypothetical protein
MSEKDSITADAPSPSSSGKSESTIPAFKAAATLLASKKLNAISEDDSRLKNINPDSTPEPNPFGSGSGLSLGGLSAAKFAGIIL